MGATGAHAGESGLMTEREFAELRPWMDGDTVSVGYHPKRLVAKGYLRRVVDGQGPARDGNPHGNESGDVESWRCAA